MDKYQKNNCIMLHAILWWMCWFPFGNVVSCYTSKRSFGMFFLQLTINNTWFYSNFSGALFKYFYAFFQFSYFQESIFRHFSLGMFLLISIISIKANHLEFSVFLLQTSKMHLIFLKTFLKALKNGQIWLTDDTINQKGTIL